MKVDLWVARKLWQKLVFVVVAKVKTVTLLSGLRYSPRARTAITSHKARSRHGSTIILPCRAVQREGGGGLLPFNVALPPHPSIHAEFVHAPLLSSPLLFVRRRIFLLIVFVFFLSFSFSPRETSKDTNATRILILIPRSCIYAFLHRFL